MTKLFAFLVLATFSGLVTHVQSVAVTGVSITFAAGDRKAAQVTTGITTVSFTTTTNLLADGTITITLPASYFTAMSAQPTGVAVPASGSVPTLACVLTAATLKIVCTTSVNTLTAGATKITFAAGQLTTGTATQGLATGLTVTTSEDTVSNPGSIAPSLGTVSDVSITMATFDKNQLQVTTATVTVAFTTVSNLPFAASAGTITITLPSGYFSAKAAPAGVLVPASGTATLTATCTLAAGLTIICITATADLAAGAHKITFAAGELTTGAAVAVASTGLTVRTATDAVSAGASAPALVTAVTGVQMLLSVADRIPTKATGNTTTFLFTTASNLPFAASAGKITITLPANYFSAKATPAGVLVPASGTATLTATCTLTAATLTIVCTTATADLAAGTHTITFAAGELTTGAAATSSAAGLMVATAVDAASLGASVPALAVGAPTNTKSASALLSSAFLSLVFAFVLNL